VGPRPDLDTVTRGKNINFKYENEKLVFKASEIKVPVLWTCTTGGRNAFRVFEGNFFEYDHLQDRDKNIILKWI